ncbi:MAG: cobalamin-dependent protein [Deltaproteobacteria bacterium]|nr:cobalamin-dependent protein [Deltaproteobacteria bacterium]
MVQTLAESLASFDEQNVMGEVDKRLGSDSNPIELVRELQEGMKLVGERFNAGTYFLSELLMSADLFTRALAKVEPHLAGQTTEIIGKIVLGTPKGDIHDLGKNIFRDVAKAAGFEIHDLGVDVPTAKFIAAVEDIKPDVLGFSALITTAFGTMKDVVDTLVEKNLRNGLRIIVGGGVVTDAVRKHIGADRFTLDAMEGVNICQEFVSAN